VIRRGVGCGGEMVIGYKFMGEKFILTTIIENERGQSIFDLEIKSQGGDHWSSEKDP
jgi:hypothetical protein